MIASPTTPSIVTILALTMQDVVLSSLWDALVEVYKAIGLSTVLTLGVALLTIIVTIRLQKKKSLAYTVSSIDRLLRVDQNIADSIQVIYRGRVVESLTLVRVKISNTGNQPIQPGDFHSPLAIGFPAGTAVISVETGNSTPPDLSPEATLGDSVVTFSPFLFNQRDDFTATILVNGPATPLTVTARIMGVRRIRKSEYTLRQFAFPITALTALVIAGIRLSTSNVASPDNDPVFLMFFFAAYIAMTLTIFTPKRARRVLSLIFENSRFRRGPEASPQPETTRLTRTPIKSRRHTKRLDQ